MDHDELLRYKKLVNRLSGLPKKIVDLHGHDDLGNISEFVLHDLCHQDSFNLKKAAFLIDNPDFDCVQGVAGFSAQETYAVDKMWNEPSYFTEFMQTSPFNQKVRSFCVCSVKRNGHSYTPFVDQVAEQLELRQPAYSIWDMKHQNHGVLVYEKEDLDQDLFDNHFINSLYLLSLCPVH